MSIIKKKKRKGDRQSVGRAGALFPKTFAT